MNNITLNHKLLTIILLYSHSNMAYCLHIKATIETFCLQEALFNSSPVHDKDNLFPPPIPKMFEALISTAMSWFQTLADNFPIDKS